MLCKLEPVAESFIPIAVNEKHRKTIMIDHLMVESSTFSLVFCFSRLDMSLFASVSATCDLTVLPLLDVSLSVPVYVTDDLSVLPPLLAAEDFLKKVTIVYYNNACGTSVR